MIRSLTAGACALALFAAPVQPANANDLGKVLAVGAIGAIAFCGISNKCFKGKKNRTTSSSTARSQPAQAPSPQRQANRQVQSSLNTFGFNAGSVDGSIGPQSRAAIQRFQSFMGYPSTGTLTDYQRGILVSSQQRMQSGEAAQWPDIQQAEGPQGLLKAMNVPGYVEQFRQASVPSAPPSLPAPTGPQAVPPPPPAPAGTNNLPTGADNTIQNDALPELPFARSDSPASATSMSESCGVVEVLQATNGGPVGAAGIVDSETARQALDQQFCNARSYAINEAHGLAASLDVTPDQVTEICSQIARAMASDLDGDTARTPQELAQSVGSELAANEQFSDPETASAVGRLCLGTGYRQDDPRMALGGAALALGSGRMAYSEVFGHHFREGYGLPKSEDTAASYYETAADSLDAGEQPAFWPGQSDERPDVIRAAVERSAWQAGQLQLAPTAER